VPFEGSLAFRDCPWCGLRDAQFAIHNPSVQAAPHVGRVREWSLLSCPRCAGAVLLETTVQAGAIVVLQELPEADRAKHMVSHLPDDVARYYSSAIRALDAGIPDAAAVQLRRTLEAASAARGVTHGALVARIRHLISEGKITAEFGQVLDHIRQVGNVGAHAGDQEVDEASARRALLFTTQVLRNLFEIPAELARLAGDQPEPDTHVD
jgi:hypothetical protein